MFYQKPAETKERVRLGLMRRWRWRAFDGCGVTRSRAGAGANLGAGRRRSERVLRMYTNCGGSGGGGGGCWTAGCARTAGQHVPTVIAGHRPQPWPPPPRAHLRL